MPVITSYSIHYTKLYDVHAIGDGEADQQDADEEPPDQFQNFIVDNHVASPSGGRAGLLFQVVAAGAQGTRSLAGEMEHQPHLDHQQEGVEADEADQTEDQVTLV